MGLTAVKTALFHDHQHATEVRHALTDSHHKRILIIGTSGNAPERRDVVKGRAKSR